MSKLIDKTDEEILDIRNKILTAVPTKDICNTHGITLADISRVAKNHLRKTLDLPRFELGVFTRYETFVDQVNKLDQLLSSAPELKRNRAFQRQYRTAQQLLQKYETKVKQIQLEHLPQ